MRTILYYRKKDFEITQLISNIREICERYNFQFVAIDVEGLKDSEILKKKSTPGLTVGPYSLNYPFTLSDVDIAVNAASKKADLSRNKSIEKARNKNQIGIFLSKFYPGLIALLLALFVGGAFIAPLLMINGNNQAAKTIYGFYRIFCHQLAFRSFFLEGKQAFYPRELAHIDNLTTYEQEFKDPNINIEVARKNVGNTVAGFKVALCERDLAIYSSLGLLAFIFQVSGRKIKPIRWYLWFLIAIIPIGIDGFSQIPGLSSGWPAWVPIRESTPFLRLATGSLFGGMTGWYMFPLMEESMRDTHQQLITQREIIKAILADKKRDKKNNR